MQLILAKQKVDQYGCEIIRELNALGVRARVESEMQDLLSERCVEMVMRVFRLAASERDPRSWQEILQLLAVILQINPARIFQIRPG